MPTFAHLPPFSTPPCDQTQGKESSTLGKNESLCLGTKNPRIETVPRLRVPLSRQTLGLCRSPGLGVRLSWKSTYGILKALGLVPQYTTTGEQNWIQQAGTALKFYFFSFLTTHMSSWQIKKLWRKSFTLAHTGKHAHVQVNK